MTMIDDIITNDGVMELAIVEHTAKKGGGKMIGSNAYTSYTVKGHDSLGEFEVERRYSEFLMFRTYLFARYPGLLIPQVPGKNISGNTKEAIVEERRYLLNLFLKNLCK